MIYESWKVDNSKQALLALFVPDELWTPDIESSYMMPSVSSLWSASPAHRLRWKWSHTRSSLPWWQCSGRTSSHPHSRFVEWDIDQGWHRQQHNLHPNNSTKMQWLAPMGSSSRMTVNRLCGFQNMTAVRFWKNPRFSVRLFVFCRLMFRIQCELWNKYCITLLNELKLRCITVVAPVLPTCHCRDTGTVVPFCDAVNSSCLVFSVQYTYYRGLTHHWR